MTVGTEQLRLHLGRAIRDARKLAKLTQDDLAALLQTTQATLSRWELGDVLTLDQVCAIEDALRLTRGHLLVAAGYVPLGTSTEDVVRLDPGLDALDKEALLLLYSVFLKRSAD